MLDHHPRSRTTECSHVWTSPSFWPYVVLIKISRWYLKWFKSYRVDKHTNTPTNRHYSTENITSLHHAAWMATMSVVSYFVHSVEAAVPLICVSA